MINQINGSLAKVYSTIFYSGEFVWLLEAIKVYIEVNVMMRFVIKIFFGENEHYFSLLFLSCYAFLEKLACYRNGI